ncbi:MOSC domain-containing protein [Paludifilum halophilum]|uniref:MOSC domain-containing protein n=1 Tax=Paludifilum halophilum TaxID=1642702 RepID=A0A235B2I1_9BACL|nr:MOSC domain-containing protein [Paludifilum halophilum]OYD06452.1 MOSC domain-containing protein [Paludifilum halophilum]
MSSPFLLQIHVGMPRSVGVEHAVHPMERPWRSGIFKQPVQGPVRLGKTGLDGDGQADLKHHGGPEKAVLVYADAHYPLWRRELGFSDFDGGAFGENFIVSGMTEKDVCVGDVYRIGEAVVQVSQPRLPCWKPARRWRVKDLALQMQNTGRTGWYLRVIEEGMVEPGDAIQRLDRPYPQWTIARCNDILHHQENDRRAAADLAACHLLAENWVKALSKRAATGENGDSKPRVIGPNEE